MARNLRLFQVAGAAVRWGGRLILLLLLVFTGLVIAYRFVNPVSTLMLGRMLLHQKVDQKWVPLSGISEALRAAVVTSEDAHFCRHHGVDWGAMREVIDDNGIGGASRGASTITMQVAKNLFLWPGRSYIRKALEIPIALVLDFVWPNAAFWKSTSTSPNGATTASSVPRPPPISIFMSRRRRSPCIRRRCSPLSCPIRIAAKC